MESVSNSDESMSRTSNSDQTSGSTTESSLKYEEEKAKEEEERDSYKQKQITMRLSSSFQTQTSQLSSKSQDIAWTPTQVNGVVSCQDQSGESVPSNQED